MSTANVITCDSCGTKRTIGQPSKTIWLKVMSSLADNEEVSRLQEKLLAGAKVDDLLDSGDFCSLICVSNWASAHANIREMDSFDPNVPEEGPPAPDLPDIPNV